MGAGLVRLDPPLAVGQRQRRLQEVPRRRPLDLVGRRGQDQPGTAQGEGACHLGEVAVEPDDEAHSPEHRVLERRQPIARDEHRVLEGGPVQMRLSVPGPQPPVGVEDEGGVVDLPVVAQLGDASSGEEQVVPPRRVRQALGARPLPRFGVVPGILGERLGVVAARPELGQDEQLDTSCRRPLDHAQGDREVLSRLPRSGQPLGHPDQKVPLHVLTRFTGSHSSRSCPGTLRRQRSGIVSRL